MTSGLRMLLFISVSGYPFFMGVCKQNSWPI